MYNKILISILFVFLMLGLHAQRKVRTLRKVEIEKNSMRYDKLLMLPGTKHKLGFVLVTKEGRFVKTKGYLKGSLRWSEFIIEVEHAQYKNGRIEINNVAPDVVLAYLPMKIKLKRYPETIYYDTIWLNYETKVEILALNNPPKIPGAVQNFGLRVTYDNDEVEYITHASKLKKALIQYQVLVKGGTHNGPYFMVSNDIFENPDHTPGFMVRLIKDSTVFDVFDLMLDYKSIFAYDGSGKMGTSGMFGFIGFSTCDGCIGLPGSNGFYGKDGYKGNDLDVYTDVYYDSILKAPLMKVRVDNISNMSTSYYLVNPNGGRINISASGGIGGSGGSGGAGGRGGTGEDGRVYIEYVEERIVTVDSSKKETVEIKRIPVKKQEPGYDGAPGGPGGHGGHGGSGGDGGHIILHYTGAALPYLKNIQLDVSGGRGGMAVLQVEEDMVVEEEKGILMEEKAFLVLKVWKVHTDLMGIKG